MGGTFDPIHNGHLVAASEVQQQFELDEVIFVPTGEPWMKPGVTEGEHRYLMTVIATAANPESRAFHSSFAARTHPHHSRFARARRKLA